MSKQGDEMTVAQLEQLLNTRRTQLDNLLRKRERLTKELEEVEKKIDEIDGITGGRRRRRNMTPRPRNPQSLQKVVIELLTKNKKGFTLSELADAVLATGYKTNSTNFPNVLYQCLYNSNKFFHDPQTGTYKIDKEKISAAKG